MKQGTSLAGRPHARDFSEVLHSMPLLDLRGGRQALRAYFENTWALTELLFSALAGREAFYVRPYHKTRHPLIFYYAHPACLYVNKLLVSGLVTEPVNKEFELLFETGVDEMNWDDLHEGEHDIWPELEEVIAYRQKVYELVRDVLETHPCFDSPVTMDSPGWGLAMAFEHERIHLETSSVLMRELPVDHLVTPAGWPAFHSQRPETPVKPTAGRDYPAQNPLLEVRSRIVLPGKPAGWPTFGWDNEYGSDRRQVASFKASKYLVSNGEFREFVAAGGYETPKYWSETGWDWRRFRNVKWPTFWVQDGPAGSHRYRLRTIFNVIDMQWDWPAVVNFYEARAYCAWLTEKLGAAQPFRLLQESEHLAIRDDALRETSKWTPGNQALLESDPVMTEAGIARFNANLRFGGECPVDAMPANDAGFHDSLGNVWQWCEDAFHPLPGFRIHPYYTDFSTPCFDGEHQMILGGSFISSGDEASVWARFHFRPHFFQHAGFRVAQGQETPDAEANKYETSDLVDQYLLFHYGPAAEQFDEQIALRTGRPQTGNFVQHTAGLARRFASAGGSALDLGCAVGGASFELARDFETVVGLDYSASFIRAARRLQADGSLPFRRRETGRYHSELTARVPDGIERDRIRFVEGDAGALARDLGGCRGRPFDAILLANLLCRLPGPQACLRQFVASDAWLAQDGVLVIASPNTWLEQYTSQSKYLDGESSADTLARLAEILEGFELLHEEDYPFMLREHRRKYEYIISQVSVWRKTGA